MSDAALAVAELTRARADARRRAATLAMFFSHGLLFASWAAHIPAVRAHLGLSDAELGLILLGTPVGAVCAMMLTGRLLPLAGSRRTTSICLLGYCASGPLVGLAAAPWQLACALFAWGAFQGSLDVAMNTQAVAVQKAQGRHLMPTFHGAWSLGALSGAAIGLGAVGAHIALTPQLLILAVPVLGAAAVLTGSMVDDHAMESHREHRPRLWRNRAAMTLGAIALATMLCEGATADWSAVYLRGPAHITPSIAGLGYTLFALLMASVRLAGTRLLARYDAHHLLPIFALLATAGMASALASGNSALGLAGFASLGVGTALVVPSVFTAAGNLPRLPPAAAIGTVSAFGWAGFVCGPPLIGQLAAIAGLRSALAILPILTLLIAVATSRTPTPPTVSTSNAAGALGQPL